MMHPAYYTKLESEMGSAKFTFKRYEKKYLLSREKYEALRRLIDGHIVPDEYFESTVCSIYYDSDDYHLIRYSIERPVYKEKLRVRSYNVPEDADAVFVELKKKYKGIVYKRRVRMRADEAPEYLAGHIPAPRENQMSHEIDWFLRQNKPTPKVFIACDRQAYVASDDPELRITFDHNMRWRETELDLRAGSHGEPLVDDDMVLMEIKIPGSAPLWLAHILAELDIFPTGFSKYGVCYRDNILDKYINGVITCV